jgi:plasmid stabilization system protein ParE
MTVVWSPRARKELHEAIDFIARGKPEADLRVANRIYNETASLAKTPHLGRIGLVPDTRELIFPPWP